MIIDPHSTCPKCNAKMDRHACTEAPYSMFACDSTFYLSGRFVQSEKCANIEVALLAATDAAGEKQPK